MLIRAFGLERLSPKYTLHLQDEIWKGKDGIARALYVTAQGKRIVVVRGFTKQTQKTPRNEIKVALKLAKEVT
jgi:phage-related protein